MRGAADAKELLDMQLSFVQALSEPIDPGGPAPLLPSCRLYVASSLLFRTFGPLLLPRRFLVPSLLLPCCSLDALLSLSCRCPDARLSLSCRFLSILVASCRVLSLCYYLPGAFLLLSCRSPVAPSRRSPVAISCCLPVASRRLPVVFLLLPCRLPVTSLSSPCCPACYPVTLLLLACRSPVAFPSPSCRLPLASLSLPCRPMC